MGLAISIVVLIIISIIIIIYLFIITSKNYKKQELFSQLKTELLLSCFLHQISFIPFFRNSIKTELGNIFCNASVIVNLMTIHCTLMLGLAIPYILYQMIKNAYQIESKKTQYHLIISITIWVLSIGFSIVIFVHGIVVIENDTICWFENTTPNYILFGTTCVLNIGIIISFCLLRGKIKKDLKEINDPLIVNKYVSSISYFFYFLILTIMSPIIDLVRFLLDKEQYGDIFLISEDILLCIQYTLIPMVFCLNRENIKKTCCCCCAQGYTAARISEYTITTDLLSSEE